MWPPAVDKPSRHMQRCPSYPSLSDRCNTSHSKVGGAFISLSDFVLVPVFHLCVSSLQPPLYPGLFGMCTAGWSVSAVLLVGLSTFCKCPSWSLLCLYVHSARSSASCKEPCKLLSGKRVWPLLATLCSSKPLVYQSFRKNQVQVTLVGIRR